MSGATHPLDRPLVVMCAPNGARRAAADHPRLPVTLEAMLREAEAAAEAGAVALHVHVRDDGGRHSLDPDLNRRWYETLQGRLGHRLVIQLTTEAAGRYGPEAQMAVVEAVRPESVSLALRELAPAGDPAPAVVAFLARLAEWRVAPQFILYTPGEVARLHALRRRSLVPGTPPVLFVLGRHAGPDGRTDPRALDAFLALHDESCPWMVCAFGREETCALAHALACGGHARVGFENALVHGDGRPAASNAERVATVRTLARLLGRPLADLAEARRMLGVDGRAATTTRRSG